MNDSPVTVEARVDAQIFRQFALFDARRVKKVWRSPLIFALILCAFSAACFAMRDRAQASLLGSVLLGVGIGLPAVYYGVFRYSLRKQVLRMKLGKGRAVYTLNFTRDPDGIAATYPGGHAERFAWADVFGAYRVPGGVYLYVRANKAFILPGEQQICWELFCHMLDAKKLQG